MESAATEHVIDLLGALAYTELTAFSRLAGDAEHAPTLAERVAVADLAVAEYRHFERLSARIIELGAVPQAAMAAFVAPVDAFHDRTTPSDWLERLVKAYVGDAIGTDFYREIAGFVDPATRELVQDVLRDSDRLDVIADVVRAAVEADPAVTGRLALWARRLVGEALSQAQRVVVDREGLAALVVGMGEAPGMELGEIGRLLTRLTDRHQERLRTLGLGA